MRARRSGRNPDQLTPSMTETPAAGPPLSEANMLITGGTGSFGQRLLFTLLEQHRPRQARSPRAVRPAVKGIGPSEKRHGVMVRDHDQRLIGTELLALAGLAQPSECSTRVRAVFPSRKP